MTISTSVPIETLPGAGLTDPWADALTKASIDLSGIPKDDYSAALVGPAKDALAKLQTVRRVCWQALDTQIDRFGQSRAMVTGAQERAKLAVPTSGWGDGASYQQAVASAANDVWRLSKIDVANQVLRDMSGPADDAATAFATSLGVAAAAVQLASQQWVGPPSLRPGWTAADVAKVDALEREIARSGLKDASQYLDAAIGAGAPERDVFIYCAAALRVIQDVQKETPAMRSMRLPSQGGAAAAGELDASYDLWNRINAYCIAHKPASIAVVSRVLVAVEAVAIDLCGTTGNIGRLSVGAFESQFLNPEKQKQQGEIVKLQLRRGWLASYLGPKGSPPAGYSPVAGRTAGDVPYRFAAGAE
jgi:hypothetical protein